MSKQITIPEGSIIILPKNNLQIDGYILLGDLRVGEKEVEVFRDFAEYKKTLTKEAKKK